MELTVKKFEELSTTELYDLLLVRAAIFVVEQNCVYQDLDGKDLAAYHITYKENNRILAYARVISPAAGSGTVSIGRVLTVSRGCGLGSRIMQEAILAAKQRMGADKIYIEAQTYAKGFYEKFGFIQTSDEFLEDGISHIKMLLAI